ncbi:hypothetical protein CKAN_02619300 [Cinnamomum micranthum f. kanehirae]|uniref:DUF674 domain-containing protein n=1 Tax=Cinnamomum micranthum f. kanehirae TaxID=337451 RepID=A0A443Q190_9MAGN|nr:hypothetical protein CKAN_02619300 [Cinnamomum micranthum f. kanehirae]
MAAKEISLKLLIHKERNQILYAESGNDFVDVLFSFLTMPIGTVIRLAGKQSKIGCMSSLYASVEDLDVQYLQTESCKNMLLHPKSASEEHCKKLRVNIDDTEPTNYYLCNSGYPLRSNFKHSISVYLSSKQCRCGGRVNWKMPKDKSKQGAGPAGDMKDGVFVKGISRYMITDDLQISPICMGTTLELLKRLGITDATVLEEKNVNLGSEEVLHLLKHSLLSKTPLTDVFLPLQHTIDGVVLDLKVMTLDSKDMAQSHTEKESCSNSKNISVRLFMSKSRNKVLCAQVGKEFPDTLFSFLAFPLGFIVKCLGRCTNMGCLDNLYESVEQLGDKDYIKSEEHKALLVDPKLVPYFGSTNQLIQIKELLPPQLTIFNCYYCLTNETCITDGELGKCCHGYEKIQLELINPKFCDVVTELGGVFMAGQAAFMVTDELLVKPLSSISCLSLLNQFNLPLSDLEERFVSMGEEEALSLLKACFISKTVLSDVFLKRPKQLGRRSSLYS